MPKCKRCGKKGLFLSVNSQGLCIECASQAQNEQQEATAFLDNVKKENEKLQSRLDKENQVLAIYNAANEQYKKDKDIYALIAAYEKAFVDSNVQLTHKGMMKLADLYVKTKQHDKAWAYLHRIQARDPFNWSFVSSIRFIMAKILKKEGRNKQAILMMMLGHADQIDQYHPFNREEFEKDIKIMANKLYWDERKIQQLEDIVSSTNTNDSREGTVIEQFRKICKTWETEQ